MLRAGPNLVLVQEHQHSAEPGNAKIDSIGVRVTDLGEATDKWVAGGGTVRSRTGKTAIAVDPWGLTCELVETTATKEAGYSHVNIATENPEDLLAWYETNLGGTPVTPAWDPSRPALQYDTVQLAFMKPRSEGVGDVSEIRHLDHLGWLTDDLDATCERMLAGGVSFPANALGGRPNPPTRNGPRTPAFGEDPCGIWFELVQIPNPETYKAGLG